MYKYILLIPFVFFIQSCATPPSIDQLSIQQIVNLTKVTSTEFDSYIKITGVDIGNTMMRGLTLDVEKYYMRSNIGKSDNKLGWHQLYFDIKYTANDWRYYNGADASGGVNLSTTEISKDVIYCSGNMFGACDYREIIGVNLSYSDIENGAKNGFSLRFNTRYSNIFNLVYLPPNYFQGYLVVLDKYIKK